MGTMAQLENAEDNTTTTTTTTTTNTATTTEQSQDHRIWKCWKKRPASYRLGKSSSGRSAFGAVLRPFKHAVSTQNTRFMEDGFDLDIAYVTKRIIVHGVPNVSADPLYDDPRTEVRRLLDKYHYDRYKAYTFASELAQMTPPTAVVDARVERYPFMDDTCPPLESVVDFCENAKAWLDAHEDNVVSLHCKAGKGRAGIMAACLMVRMGETAQAALTSFDATQGADIRRAGTNQRAWVFLYERLIREVWGLRETIGTVSGQNPSLRAPPRLATGIRDVALQLNVPPRQSRWKQILHHPSCAVYQQTPGGKALVHRARMPSVSPRKKGQASSVFSAALPRSVVVEGTFQVVVSASTGLFGVGKNVLDVWCNTTFLREDGGREMFAFTENDLPPGPLAKRLLAAKVSVVLTHAQPDATTPDRRHFHSIGWDGEDALDGGDRDTTAASSAMVSIEPETSDDSTDENVSANSNNSAPTGNGERDTSRSPPRGAAQISSGDGNSSRLYLSSDDEDDNDDDDLTARAPKGTPARQNRSLQVTRGLDPVRVLSSTSPWSIQGSNCNFASSSGFTTPLSSTLPSPIRSCPRSAISSKRERLNEKTDRRDAWAQQQAEAAPSGVPRWVSSKTFGTPSQRKRHLVPTVDACGKQQDRRSLALPASREVEGGAGGRRANKPWAAETPDAELENAQTIRLDQLALVRHSHGDGWDRGNEEGEDSSSSHKQGQVSNVMDISATSDLSTLSRGFMKPSPAVKLLLDTASARSFDDLQSSKHTSVVGSDTDLSEAGGGKGMVGSSCAHGGKEKQSLVTRVLARWIDSGVRPSLPDSVSASTSAPRDTEHRVTVTAVTSEIALDSTMLIDSDDVETIQPLNERGWPPVRGVVAGVEEVQGALDSPTDGGAQQPHKSRHTRRYGSTGMSWGEDAKLALARKRLQWEKSRRGASERGSQSLRLHAALVAKREAELLAIETDVKQAVRLLEERIARRECAEAALKKWRRQLPPKAYDDVMSCLAANQTFGLYESG